MPHELSGKAESQLDRLDIVKSISFTINGVERKNDLLSYNCSFDRDFGIASLTVSLLNNDGAYSVGGSKEIKLGHEIVLTEGFSGTSDTYYIFTGEVRQRNVSKSRGTNSIDLVCLDYIVKLQDTDVDELYEAEKEQIVDEVLEPEYLSSPNDMYASVFTFANENIATYPPVSVRIKNKNTLLEDPQYSGYEVSYDIGQLTLGSLINARDNYDVIATYNYYSQGLFIEDILEDLMTKQNGYGFYLFGESSAEDVITNHLTETYENMNQSTTDTMTPNYLAEESISIVTTLTTACVAGDTSIEVGDTSGYPTTGEGTVNGDLFSWTGKTATTLTGIPTTDEYALRSHAVGSVVKYTKDYAVGELWYLSYNNLITDLIEGNFTIPGGASFVYFDKRYGRLILDQAINVNSVVTCDVDYSFKTIQATGIEINRINFSEREIENRFEAINELREFLAPNYLIRTIGEKKIWATYISQKINEDFTIKAKKSLDYSEDTDVYTRTVFFGKNNNPHNLMYDDGVTFIDTGEEYTAETTDTTLSYSGDYGNYRVYQTAISGVGKINTSSGVTPIVYVDGYPIDNDIHEIINAQCTVVSRVKVVTRTSSGTSSTDVQTSTYYYYHVYLGHTGIHPSKVIKLYNASGALLYTLGPNDSNVDYESGVWNVPGDNENGTVAQISTADYWVMYSSDKLIIDYDRAVFLVSKSLVPLPNEQRISASFAFWTTLTAINNAGNCFDGRYDTQTQTVFSLEPPNGYVYAIIDLGSIQTIQAVDIVSGFFIPDDNPNRKIDFTNKYTVQWSLDNIVYYDIAEDTNNFDLGAGGTVSWDEDVLGERFQARYLKLVLNNVQKIEYNPYDLPAGGVWVVAFTEIFIFSDIVLKGESKLIPTTELTDSIITGASSIPVLNTSVFHSGAGFAYIDSNSFWYSSKTDTSFDGVTGAGAHSSGTQITESLVSDTSIVDEGYLLEKLGDIVYKNMDINEYLVTQEKVDKRAKDYLKEFYKNHTKLDISCLFSPHISVGMTGRVVDTVNRIDQNYFVEAISYSENGSMLTVARYPG